MHRTKFSSSTSGFGVTPLLVVLAIVALIGVMFALVGHKAGDSFKLNNGCKDTNISIQPLTIPSLTSSITLEAKLTMGSQPVSGERITFRAVGQDSKGRNLQVLMGYAQTNPDGTAGLMKADGFSGELITFGSSGKISAYEAEFDGASAIKKNEPFYCGSKATANLIVTQQASD